jgi:hypothetical protein
MSSIRLSERHGVNPMLVVCEICGADTNDLALLGRLKEDAEAPRKGSLPGVLCDSCMGVLKQGGGILIEVRDGETGSTPFRTGQIWGMSKQGWAKMPIQDGKRVAFITESDAKQLGLKKGDL